MIKRNQKMKNRMNINKKQHRIKNNNQNSSQNMNNKTFQNNGHFKKKISNFGSLIIVSKLNLKSIKKNMKDHINQIIENKNRTIDPGTDINTSSTMDRDNLDHNTIIEENKNSSEITTNITIIKI